LHEKSLGFYRGTQTKQALVEIDQNLRQLIEILAPFFLHSETHKVIEYLIRVYEINAFQKETIVLSFIPYFETSTFLRLIQTLNLKEDYQFLEDYAYKG
jgi:U3 small nucleolar RNA-associated protein 10